MSTDQTPALARATEALAHRVHSQMGVEDATCILPTTGFRGDAFTAVSAALHDPEWLTVVLHDADCPDRTCEPGTMSRYRRQADAVRAAILGPGSVDAPRRRETS